jgi:hypothetical protein
MKLEQEHGGGLRAKEGRASIVLKDGEEEGKKKLKKGKKKGR